MFMLAQIVTRVRNVLIQKIEIFLKTQQEEEIENYYSQVLHVAIKFANSTFSLIDDESSHALLFTSDCTCCEGNYQNLLQSMSIIHHCRIQIHNSLNSHYLRF